MMCTETRDGRLKRMRDATRINREQRAVASHRQNQPTVFEVHSDIKVEDA